MRLKALGTALGGAVLLIGCHTITEELPTQPSDPPATGVLTVPIPAIPLSNPSTTPTPAPTPTPTPAPDTSPTPSPTPNPPAPAPEPDPVDEPEPDPDPPSSSGCGKPTPPELSRIKTKIHLRGPRGYTLDSTPLVGPDSGYCAKIGFTDGRSYCPVRPEGAKDREACEAKVVGRAKDTGRPGPTWTRNGKLCDANTCENHPDNQYLLMAYKSGLYEACSKSGVCGSVQVD